jgi:hypothetical protein
MEESGPFSQFSNILCISLKRNKERREHIKKEFDRVGIHTYQYIDAFDKSSKEVNEVYYSDYVAKFPPCFRCGKDDCNCENKSLFRPQIGNWLSHMAAWRSVPSDTLNLALICEDDVKFRDGIYNSLQLVAESEEINNSLERAAPVLVRLGWALCDDHQNDGSPRLTRQIKMANPCYAINAAMSNRLLDSLIEINTTSDIYVHKIIGSGINHYTVIPPPAYELSWSTGELLSEIRPKQKRLDHLRQLLDNMELSSPEYAVTKTSYERELKRLNQYEEFNESPTPGYGEKFDLI